MSRKTCEANGRKLSYALDSAVITRYNQYMDKYERKYSIYKAENTLTGECYIGRTSAGLKMRRRWHLQNCKKPCICGYNSKFFKALRAYPQDVFKWEVLEEDLDYEESFVRETYYIEKYDACDKGYNTTTGDRVPWNKGKKMSEEYCANLRGEKNGMYGKTHTPEYRKWRSEYMKRCQLGSANHAAHRVRCIETGRTWDSIVECANELGVNRDSISHVCSPNYRQKTAGGLHFEYA